MTKNIYKRVPVLIKEGKGNSGNSWGITFRQGLFNMTSDSHLFRTYQQLSADGAELVGTIWHYQNGSSYLPLYEAKMIHQFDHRWAAYEDNGKDSRDVSMEEKGDPSYEPLPRYWVPEEDVEAVLANKWESKWILGFRDICRATDERTVIASVIPRAGVGNNMPLLLLDAKISSQQACALLGNLTALAFDFVARHKVGGTHLNFFIAKQLPVLPPAKYTLSELDFIVSRVLELTYTSEYLRQWAEALDYQGDPFPWNPERRAQLRAELDAYYAILYGLTRDELRYILDPADVYGDDYPSETFRVLKNNEMREFGEYRTRRLVLEAWDRLAE